MKPESFKEVECDYPLKKEDVLFKTSHGVQEKYIKVKRLESAVEWLKERVNKLKVKNALVLCDVYELIDEAFEDVIK